MSSSHARLVLLLKMENSWPPFLSIIIMNNVHWLEVRDASSSEWKFQRIVLAGLCNVTQQTQNIYVTFVQRRPNVFDVGQTLYKCYTNVLCLLGSCVIVYYIGFSRKRDAIIKTTYHIQIQSCWSDGIIICKKEWWIRRPHFILWGLNTPCRLQSVISQALIERHVAHASVPGSIPADPTSIIQKIYNGPVTLGGLSNENHRTTVRFCSVVVRQIRFVFGDVRYHVTSVNNSFCPVYTFLNVLVIPP